MKNQKQFAASALLISLLLVSCDSGKALNNAVTGTGGGTTPEEGETTVEELTDGLENINYGGAKFNIVYSVDQLGAAWPYDAETEKGDRLNDSVYKRNHTVEDRFNVDINYVSTGGVMNEVPQALMKSVRSGIRIIISRYRTHTRRCPRCSRKDASLIFSRCPILISQSRGGTRQ